MAHFIPRIVISTAIVFVLAVVVTQTVQAQQYAVIYTFSYLQDGINPDAGLTMDRGGNLYGTTAYGGGAGCNNGPPCGTVFQLKHAGLSWVFNPLYSFHGYDGSYPAAGVIFGPDGGLYGTTAYGGSSGYGTVFKLRPSPRACKTALCPWTETVLYQFTGYQDGTNPGYGNVVFDRAGNIYGTTFQGGEGDCPGGFSGCGVVYELSPSGGGWTQTVVHSFTGGTDGGNPLAGLIVDGLGNLYGTTYQGGNLACDYGPGCGVVFGLSPSGSGWTEETLYSFQANDDGNNPWGGLILDQSGNLYGTTVQGPIGGNYGGTVFELTPSDGHWTFGLLYTFPEHRQGPEASLTMDALGNLYGTTFGYGAYDYGNVFKLTPSNGGWLYTSLYDFTGGTDGAYPMSNLVVDANGNLYGTTTFGGDYQCGAGSGCGVVFEITP